MKVFVAFLLKPCICSYEPKYMEDTDIVRLNKRMKPFQKEGFRIINIRTVYR